MTLEKLEKVIRVFIAELRKIQKMGIPHVKKMADALEEALDAE